MFHPIRPAASYPLTMRGKIWGAGHTVYLDPTNNRMLPRYEHHIKANGYLPWLEKRIDNADPFVSRFMDNVIEQSRGEPVYILCISCSKFKCHHVSTVVKLFKSKQNLLRILEGE